MKWNHATTYTAYFGSWRLARLRDDVCSGWEWMLLEDNVSRVYGQSKSLSAAKRAAVREAKRLGWTK